MSRSKCLQEIAEALGVPVTAPYRLKEARLLLTDADGARRVLLLNPHSCPVVRGIGGGFGQGMIEENVPSFSRRAEESLQYEALSDLFNQLLLL